MKCLQDLMSPRTSGRRLLCKPKWVALRRDYSFASQKTREQIFRFVFSSFVRPKYSLGCLNCSFASQKNKGKSILFVFSSLVCLQDSLICHKLKDFFFCSPLRLAKSILWFASIIPLLRKKTKEKVSFLYSPLWFAKSILWFATNQKRTWTGKLVRR